MVGLLVLGNRRIRESTLPGVDKTEIVQQGLDGPNTGVVAVVASNLARQRFGDTSFGSNQLPSRSTCFAKAALEEIDDGFHEHRE